MTRQELFRAARTEVERRRQAAEMQAIQRRDALYTALPELYELDLQKAETGALAARLAAEGQRDAAREKLEALHAISLRRELLLKQKGFAAQDLTPRYICALCNDSGIAGGEVCSCVLEEVKRLRRDAVNSSGPLVLCRFENFELERYPEQMEGVVASPRAMMEKILRDCMDYAGDFGPRSPSLLMFGDAGLGKTHLALSIASQVLDKGYDVIYVSAQSAFASVSSERFSNGGALFDSMLKADLLVLDDLGTEYLDAYILSKLYELVNGRMHHRPTLYTSNICRQDTLNQRYTEKIASRLLGECHLMRFWGKDLRLSKRSPAEAAKF